MMVASNVLAFVCFTDLTTYFLTVILTVFVVLPALAVIVTSPSLTPVTTPFSSTVAIVASLVVYVTFVPAGFTVAVICSVAPTATTSAALSVSAGFLTVIVAFKDLETFFPAFLAVTLTIFFHTVEHNKVDKIRRFQKACGITFVK